MPLQKSDNKTHSGLTQEDYDKYREQKGYDKHWQGAMDTDHIERERFRATAEYRGSDLEKEDIAKAEKKEKIMACFERYDMDHNDMLCIREFGRIFVDCGWRRDQCEALFKAVDKNKDKQISIKEFVNWLFKDPKTSMAEEAAIREHATRAVKPEEAIKEFFKYLKCLKDSQASDKVSAESMAATKREALFGDEGFDMEEMFNKMDINKNGEISMQEFVTGLQSMGHNIDKKMMQKVFGLIDVAQRNSKGLVDEKGEILFMKDGTLKLSEWEESWSKFM